MFQRRMSQKDSLSRSVLTYDGFIIDMGLPQGIDG
jgi:hypothetical protein